VQCRTFPLASSPPPYPKYSAHLILDTRVSTCGCRDWQAHPRLRNLGFFTQPKDVFASSTLNAFMALGRPAWRDVRVRLQNLITQRLTCLRNRHGKMCSCHSMLQRCICPSSLAITLTFTLQKNTPPMWARCSEGKRTLSCQTGKRKERAFHLRVHMPITCVVYRRLWDPPQKTSRPKWMNSQENQLD
jgi:hypothetical protein